MASKASLALRRVHGLSTDGVHPCSALLSPLVSGRLCERDALLVGVACRQGRADTVFGQGRVFQSLSLLEPQPRGMLEPASLRGVSARRATSCRVPVFRGG